jgi:hypothetical protein
MSCNASGILRRKVERGRSTSFSVDVSFGDLHKAGWSAEARKTKSWWGFIPPRLAQTHVTTVVFVRSFRTWVSVNSHFCQHTPSLPHATDLVLLFDPPIPDSHENFVMCFSERRQTNICLNACNFIISSPAFAISSITLKHTSFPSIFRAKEIQRTMKRRRFSFNSSLKELHPLVLSVF